MSNEDDREMRAKSEDNDRFAGDKKRPAPLHSKEANTRMGGGGPGGMGGGQGGPGAQGGPGGRGGPGGPGGQEDAGNEELVREVRQLRDEVRDATRQLQRIAQALEDD